MNSVKRLFLTTMAGLVFLLILAVPVPVSAQQDLQIGLAASSPAERDILSRWQQHKALPVPLLDAVLIAEGADEAALAGYRARIRAIYADLDSHLPGDGTPYDRAEALFDRLHSTVLQSYSDNAPLRATLDSGVYNCAGAMALFYGAAAHVGLPVSLYATPAHVFATLDLPDRTVRVEITDGDGGFDFSDDSPDIIDHIVRFGYVAPDDVQLHGADSIFRSFFTTDNRITDAQFLAITYNNIGVEHWHNRRYRATMEAFEKAVVLHPDSRKYRDAYQSALYLVFRQYEAGDSYDEIEHLLNRSARLMRNDTLFIYYLLGAARNVIVRYSDTDGDLHRSRRFLDTLAHVVPRDSTINALLSEQQYIVDYNLTVYDFNRGDYEGAYHSGEHLLALDTSEATRDLHAKAASYFALTLADRSRATDAYALLDSLIPLYYRHPVFRDAYRRVTIDYVLQSGLIDRRESTADDLMQARDLLLNVYDVDSSNIYLRRIIAAVHHELGMIELRAHHYTSATEILRIGLQYDPDNEFIQESLRLIEEQQRATPPPAVNAFLQAKSASPSAPAVTFTTKIGKRRKPVDKLAALSARVDTVYLHAVWKELPQDSTYIVAFHAYDDHGVELAVGEVYFTPAATGGAIWFPFAFPPDYEHEQVAFVLELDGVGVYRRSLPVLR